MKEGEFNDLLVGFPGADNAVMGPDGDSWVRRLYPFPLLLDFGVGIMNELSEMGEGLSSPVPQ